LILQKTYSNSFYKNYSKRIVPNYKNKNQNVFNLIFAGTVIRVIDFLGMENIIFKQKLDEIIGNIDIHIIPSRYGIYKIFELIDEETLENIKYKNYYYKLIYIFFCFVVNERKLIELLQSYNNIHKVNNFYDIQHGSFDFFISPNEYGLVHNFSMDRLKDYSRLQHNLQLLYNLFNENENENDLDYNINEYSSKINNTISYCELKIYLILPDNFLNGSLFSSKNDYDNNKNNYLNIKFIHTSNEVKTNISEYKTKKLCLGNYSLNLTNRLYLLDILSYILHLLDRNISTHISILLFYYILIFLMPFTAGTATIAEIALYSLLEKYIPEKRYKINENIMIDVEALSLPFRIFYSYCFNSDGTIYTPYLQEI